jgi:hypothetical protein
MMGESSSTINGRKGAGTRFLDAAGKTPMSCSAGLKGVPFSKVISRDEIFWKSEAKGAKW